jgi:hypothetical protein
MINFSKILSNSHKVIKDILVFTCKVELFKDIIFRLDLQNDLVQKSEENGLKNLKLLPLDLFNLDFPDLLEELPPESDSPS